jgi:hypothetical protein
VLMRLVARELKIPRIAYARGECRLQRQHHDYKRALRGPNNACLNFMLIPEGKFNAACPTAGRLH